MAVAFAGMTPKWKRTSDQLPNRLDPTVPNTPPEDQRSSVLSVDNLASATATDASFTIFPSPFPKVRSS